MQARLNNSFLVNVEGQEIVFSTWVSFAEVYNENIYDLLEPIGPRRQKRQILALGEDNKGQVYIKGKRAFVIIQARYSQYFFPFMFVCICEHLYVKLFLCLTKYHARKAYW
jgi:hypothetical protein